MALVGAGPAEGELLSQRLNEVQALLDATANAAAGATTRARGRRRAALLSQLEAFRVVHERLATGPAPQAQDAAAASGPANPAEAPPVRVPTELGSSSAAAPTAECQRCCDDFPAHSLLCAGATAGADGPSSSAASAAPCGHLFCEGCMREYVRGALRDKRVPVLCAMALPGGGGCGAAVSRQHVVGLLQGCPEEVQAFEVLEAEACIPPERKLYCPYPFCSMPLLRPIHEDGGELPPDKPVDCPSCSQRFCPRCLIPDWHEGFTCDRFQDLQRSASSAEDAAMLRLAVGKQWKQCPRCKQLVERSQGCNFIRCRCGGMFCYSCGTAYANATPTGGNPYGTPGCKCRASGGRSAGGGQIGGSK
ncbi:hypothetical protein TSOC_009698 [Tetrabaena socialis]|uniref:RBR-type E3 ubiquitin transferase n=1 Tax=Tetrabaena socialis TaxID=47790 RepID=A0A2J7ZV67_9CHLO|nr:hypothetical protein TSOC_009698 [Tetrabaena socialis]|eukprot:PNH04164.1 hypothetical protein TSOC_009698 [Tetrabaena socialis]